MKRRMLPRHLIYRFCSRGRRLLRSRSPLPSCAGSGSIFACQSSATCMALDSRIDGMWVELCESKKRTVAQWPILNTHLWSNLVNPCGNVSAFRDIWYYYYLQVAICRQSNCHVPARVTTCMPVGSVSWEAVVDRMRD